MGSGTSRGKRVAPARVGEVSASEGASSGRDRRAPVPLKLRARHRAEPPRCHSDGHDSDSSGEEEDHEKRERSSSAKKAKPRTYGLCHFSREDAEDDFGDGRAEEPRGPRGGSTVVNKMSDAAFTRLKRGTSDRPGLSETSTQGFMPKGTLLEAVPTPEKQSCHGSSLTMPVILYDGSEEELMDTIEREFS